MKTGLTAIRYPVRRLTPDLPAKHIPVRLVIFGKDQQQFCRIIPAMNMSVFILL